MTSVAFPAWLLGHDPRQKIVCVSYSQDLAAKHARDCRSVMESRWYLDLFPGTRLDAAKNAEAEFMTSERGFRLATSTGGTLTGRGGNIIIIDDPLRAQDALSDVRREGAAQWYDGTLYSRLDNKREGVIIIVTQRLHLDDLVGQPPRLLTGLAPPRERHCAVTTGRASPWSRPAPVAREPGSGAVGTPRNGRGVETMETTMTKKAGQSPKSVTTPGTKVRAATPRRRQRQLTKTQIALSLLERSKGASIAEMQDAMGWQAHSVRGFLAGTIKKMSDLTLVSEKPESGPRRYRVGAIGA